MKNKAQKLATRPISKPKNLIKESRVESEPERSPLPPSLDKYLKLADKVLAKKAKA